MILYFQIKFIQIYIHTVYKHTHTHKICYVVYLSPIATYYYRCIRFNSRLFFVVDIFHFHISFIEAGLFDVCHQTDALPIFMQMQILCGS